MSCILIVVAMDKEFAAFKEQLTNLDISSIKGKLVYTGTINNHQIVLAKSGIGKVSAASMLSVLIEKFHPSLIINMGIAGGYKKTLHTLDTVIATSCIYSDVDMTTDAMTDLDYGQLEGYPKYFEIDEELLKVIKSLNINDVQYGMICTGDQFVTNYEKCQNIVDTYFSSYDVLAFDMESAAYFQVCYDYNIPCLIIRTISDLIGSTDPLDYEKFSTIASNKSGEICHQILLNIKEWHFLNRSVILFLKRKEKKVIKWLKLKISQSTIIPKTM